MKEKILYIVEGFGGGVYTFICDLANAMIQDYEVVIAYSRRPETPENVARDFDERIKLIKLDNSRELNFKRDIKGFITIRNLIKNEKANIIHLHCSKAGFLGRLAVATLLKIDKSKVFYNPHGFSFLQKNISSSKRKLFYLLELISSKISGTIVCVSKGEYDEALKISRKSININNSIDLKEIESIDINRDKIEDFKVATLARITEQKNPDQFNSIALQLKDTKFMWIGYGELIDKLNSGNIEITGWKEKKSGIKILSKCTIFILTSLWEGLPIALLEAMSLGIPCIVTDVVGNKDVIIHEENGFIAKNTNEFIKYIEMLKNDDELYNKISIEAKNHIYQNYSLSSMVKKYKKLYLGEKI